MHHEFFAVLPSNASHDEFPGNKLNNFKIKLQNRLDLNEDWVVGLSEIHFPSTWNNVINGYIEVKIASTALVMRLELSNGYYPTVEVLV